MDSILFKKLSLLFILYFVQALPYGLQAGTLPLLLRQRGLSFSNLGAIKLLFLPWICKPLIVRSVVRHKRFWVFFTLWALCTTCFASGSFASLDEIISISLMLLCFNFLCATLDICVDSMSVNLLDESQLGSASTVQVVAYKAGAAVSGSILLLIHEHMGWTPMFYAFGSLYLLTILGLTLQKDVQEPYGKLEKRNDDDEKRASGMWEVLQVPGTPWIILFVLIYKLNSHSTEIIPLVISDRGLSTDFIALGNSIGRLASIGGSTYSGYLLTRRQMSCLDLSKSFSSAQVIVILFQFLVLISDNYLSDSYFSVLSFICLYVNLFCAGSLTTICFTMMMSMSKGVVEADAQGTYFSVLCTFEILGKILFASLTGMISDRMGAPVSLLLCAGLTLCTLYSLKWSPQAKVSRKM
eukprot:TRINITY_DN1668_c0_g1_i1.p1 TRINITY_DN1668_c0_g1~~TRINITY_DN1668_c0_g1_i1.p1  ORF type:complete len:411 (-),score=63.98 TRINITY_DN1668_c0_g1_i1:91-1323(-)